MGQPESRPECPKIRRDGWTPKRQLRFLVTLAHTKSITRAAASAGMSRESAYRLRGRRDGALFTLLWDRALAPDHAGNPEVHNDAPGDGRLMRLLGVHFRRQRGDFLEIGRTGTATCGK
jgi:hypothetical protein